MSSERRVRFRPLDDQGFQGHVHRPWVSRVLGEADRRSRMDERVDIPVPAFSRQNRGLDY